MTKRLNRLKSKMPLQRESRLMFTGVLAELNVETGMVDHTSRLIYKVSLSHFKALVAVFPELLKIRRKREFKLLAFLAVNLDPAKKTVRATGPL